MNDTQRCLYLAAVTIAVIISLFVLPDTIQAQSSSGALSTSSAEPIATGSSSASPEAKSAEDASSLRAVWKQVREEVGLGMRLHGQMYQWTYQGPPVLDQTTFITESVSSTLPSSAVGVYGIEVGMQVRSVEFSASAHTNAGVSSNTTLLFDSGEDVVPIRPRVRRYDLQGQYLFPLGKRMELGVGMRYESRFDEVEQVSTLQSVKLFGVSTSERRVAAYLPVVVNTGRIQIESSVGTTLWSSSRVAYDLDLARYPEELFVPQRGGSERVVFDEGRIQTWEGYLGMRTSLQSVVVRLGARVETSRLSDVYDEQRVGAHVSFGLPF